MENIFTHWESVINFTRNDIVFEHQNKQYGAYAIRKYYPERLRNAFIYSVTGMIVLLAAPILIQKFFPATPHIVIPKWEGPIYENPPIFYPDVTPPVAQAKREKAVRSEGSNYIVTNNITEANPSPQSEPIQPQNTEPTGSTTSSAAGSLPVTLPGSIETPVLYAAVMPEFDRLQQYLQKHTVYPSKARELGAFGKVYVTFVVDKNGKVINAVIAKGLEVEGGEFLEQEALRVVRAMPDWKPGINNDHPVAVQLTLPINFVLR
jgi:periplasmic protein TonB